VKVIENLVNASVKFDDLAIRVFYIDKKVDPHIRIKVPVERLDRRKFSFDDFDILHTNGLRPDLFAFLNRSKIKYHISTIHNFVFDDLTFTYNRLISFIFGHVWLHLWKKADKLVCVSETQKTFYEKWFPASRLKVIYNGIAEQDESFLPDNEIIQSIQYFRSKGLKVLGCAAKLTARKGIDQLLRLIATEKDSALIIFGDGKDLQKLKHISEVLKVAERCMFCGYKSEAVKYFKYFDFFLVPSRSEAFGLVLIEAVQQRVPVICSDIDVFKELFNNNEVTYFKQENPVSLTESMAVASKNGKVKADRAYIRYHDCYTDKIMADAYHDLYAAAF
jgi:L-malate glycosyltransferase